MTHPELPEISNAAYRRLVKALIETDLHGKKGEAFLNEVCKQNPKLTKGYIMAYILDQYPIEYSKISKETRDQHPPIWFKYRVTKKSQWAGHWRTVGGYFQAKKS